MTRWSLGYDGGLYMEIPAVDIDEFCSSAFYKISIKRYVREVHDGFIRYKGALNYRDYKKIIKVCQKEGLKKGIAVDVSEDLASFIEMKELHIEKRSRLGIEIKQESEKLVTHFEEYGAIVNDSMSRNLRDKQMWDSFFMCAMQKSGNFSVPGSGKTSAVLGMYGYLKSKDLINRIVVICPKNAFGSWIDEFEICFAGKENLDYFNVHSPALSNKKDRKEAIKYNTGKCNLLLFNYESVASYLDEIKSLVDSKTLLVFDEVHKVKRIDGYHAVNSISIAHDAHYVVAMTGTPIPNTYMDIYNFLHILFPDEYDDFFNFDKRTLQRPGPDDVCEINNKLQPFFCRTTKTQLTVPESNEDIVIQSNASKEENQLLDILRMKYRNNKLALMIRIIQLESNPKLLLKTLNLSDFRYILDDSNDIADIDYVDYSDEVESLISSLNETTKQLQCVDLIRDLTQQGKPVIIWCILIDSINRLSEKLESIGIRSKCIYGEVPLEERQRILTSYKAGEFQVLLTNPHTLGESISLHHICHDAVYFEYSYNLVHLLQSKDRIHRLGLPEGQYTQFYFLQNYFNVDGVRFSLGEQIYSRLKNKEKIMLDAIDNNVLETLPTSDEDLELIFRKLK